MVRPISPAQVTIPDVHRHDVEILWDYHHLHHVLHPADVGIGLGHDPGVATVAVDLFQRGLLPRVVFTGVEQPTSVDRLPAGGAVRHRKYAVEQGVPAEAVLIETAATNIGENISLTRELLAAHGVPVGSVILMTRPYQQRRAFATCRKLWPEVDVQCAAQPLSLDEHVAVTGDVKHVINVLVGETQRIVVYASRGYMIEQELPADVRQAFQRLAYAGFIDDML